jgi:hypothetical protein
MLPGESDQRQPVGPLVYRLYDGAGDLLYIGMTDTFASYRIVKHMQQKLWGGQVQYFSLEHHRAPWLALDAERAAIKAERPRHNLRSAVTA